MHDRGLKRRREKKNLEQRTYSEAWELLNELMGDIDYFDKPIQKRLKMIEKNWDHFTAFYFFESAQILELRTN